jgi:hypothetical protein
MPCLSVVVGSHRIVQHSFPHVPQTDWKLRVGSSIGSSSSNVIIFEVVEQWFDERRQRRVEIVETLLHAARRQESPSVDFVHVVGELHIGLVIVFQSEVPKRLAFNRLRSRFLSLLELGGE